MEKSKKRERQQQQFDRFGFLVENSDSESDEPTFNKNPKKEEMEEEEIEEIEEMEMDDFLHFFAAMCLVRQAGICNMITEINCVLYDGIFPVLGLWGRSDLLRKIVSILSSYGGTSEFEKIYSFWSDTMTNNPEQRNIWEDLGAVMPYGKDYISAHQRWPFKKDTLKLDEYKEFVRQHRNSQWNWQHLVIKYAQKKATESGEFARDVVKIESMRNEFDPKHVKSAGAQLGYIQAGFGKKRRTIHYCRC